MRSLIAFWLLAVAVTAAAGSVIALSNQGGAVGGVRASSGAFHLPFPVFITLVMVSAFGPAIAAVAVTAWEAGIHGVRALLGQLLRWRAGVVWYVLALGGPAVFTLLATLVWAAGTGHQPAHWFQLAAGFQLISLPIGPWGEEIGAGVASPSSGSRPGSGAAAGPRVGRARRAQPGRAKFRTVRTGSRHLCCHCCAGGADRWPAGAPIARRR